MGEKSRPAYPFLSGVLTPPDTTLPSTLNNARSNLGNARIVAGDGQRELRSEVDVNLPWVSSALDGPVIRKSRAGMEATMAMVLSIMAVDASLSTDYKGWSPNMRRELEMAFGDMLLTFFVLPAGV